MKRLFYGGLFITLISLFLTNCEKDSINKTNHANSTNEFGVTTDGRILIFKSVEDYENAVDSENKEQRSSLLKIINDLKFKNYFDGGLSNDKNVSSQKMDDFFGQLLNEDGAIHIGNHIFKIDLSTDQVFVIDSKQEQSDYEDLINGNIDNKNVSVYSVDQEVLYLVNGGVEEKCGGIGGFDNSSNIVNLDNDGKIKFMANCRLFRAGIWFRVTGSVEYTQAYSGTAKISLEIQAPQAWMKRKPCGSGHITTHHSGVRKSGYTYRYLFEAYSKTRNLNGIYMFVRATAEITPPGQTTIVKHTNWTGRNVNSPY